MPLDQGDTQELSSLSGDAVLIWIRDDGSETRFPIIAPVTTIGRESTNMILLNDTTVSRFHAKLLYQNGQYVLTDLGSANKTFVNGQEIEESRLMSGCDIRFAGCRFKFQAFHEAAPGRAPAYPSPVAALPPFGRPPQAAPTPPWSAPYPTPPSAAKAAMPKRKPKPLVLLGGVFVVGVILIVIVSQWSKPSKPPAATRPSETTPAAPASLTPSAPATPVTALPTTPATIPASSAATPSSPPLPTTTPLAVPAPTGPQSPSKLMNDAGTLETAGRWREAMLLYEQVLKLDPSNSRARARVESLKPVIEDAINLHFKNAKQAFDYLRYEEAIDEWNIVLSLANPTDARYIESQQGIAQAQAKLKR